MSALPAPHLEAPANPRPVRQYVTHSDLSPFSALAMVLAFPGGFFLWAATIYGAMAVQQNDWTVGALVLLAWPVWTIAMGAAFISAADPS